MQDDKEYGFNFDDGFEDISSSSKKEKQIEDFFSNSAQNNKDIYSNDNYVSNDREYTYRKKKHGLSKRISDKYYKIKKWWKCMKKGKRRAIKIVSAILLALIVAVVWFFSYFDYNYKKITGDPDELGFENVIDESIINVALFGIDSRSTDGKTSFTGNSDSIMILSINAQTKKVKIISLMRDTLVPIERDSGTTYTKINAAYSWGGPELAIKTLNRNFGLDISEYATVNFYGMSDIIDAVGGIDATLTESEVKARGNNNHGINDMIQEICIYENLNPKDYYVTTAGEQHLNGVQAVAYARIRYCTNIWGTSNDYGRTDRQRYVMEQLFNKAKTLSKSEYVKLAKALIPCTETSLSYSEIMGIAYKVMFSSPTFEQYRIPQNSTEMNFLMPSPSGSFGSVVYFDLAYATKVIKAIIYDDMTIEEYVAQNGIEKNDWYAQIKKSGSYTSSSKTTSSTVSSTVSSTSSTSVSSDTSSEDVSSEDVSSQEDVSSKTQSSEVESTVSTTSVQEGGDE